MTIPREQQRVASYNAVLDSGQFTFTRNDSMPNLPFHMLNGINRQPSLPKIGERTQILCIGLGYSRQLRKQWLSLDSPIENAFVNVNPPTSMVLPALNDFTYPTLIDNEITKYSVSVKRDFLRCLFLEKFYGGFSEQPSFTQNSHQCRLINTPV